MNSIVASILKTAKKLGYFILQYAYTTMHWITRLGKIQAKSWTKNSAQRQACKSYASLGAEIYAFYRRGGDSGWQHEPAIHQQLRLAEEAEAKVLRADADIEAINAAFLVKKEEIRTKYAEKRAALDILPPSDI